MSYGGIGGARAVEQLRLVMGELMVADVRAQVMLSMFTDFVNFSVFKPDDRHEEMVTMLDQVIVWGRAPTRRDQRDRRRHYGFARRIVLPLAAVLPSTMELYRRPTLRQEAFVK